MNTQPDTTNRVLHKEGWELRIYFMKTGTRSVTMHGVLVHEGRVVEAKAEGEVVQTPLGEMKLYDGSNGGPRGWNFADRKKMREALAEAKGYIP